jgi:hypothetical protein
MGDACFEDYACDAAAVKRKTLGRCEMCVKNGRTRPVQARRPAHDARSFPGREASFLLASPWASYKVIEAKRLTWQSSSENGLRISHPGEKEI